MYINAKSIKSYNRRILLLKKQQYFNENIRDASENV